MAPKKGKKKKDDDWEDEAGLDPDLVVAKDAPAADDEEDSKQKKKVRRSVPVHMRAVGSVCAPRARTTCGCTDAAGLRGAG